MIIKEISFRNFLSFGSNWNTIEYKEGINLITGKDIDNDKSNGSGKSSAFVDTLSFALFGQTTKEIKQSRIINTQNKKNCEVKLTFIKDNDIYNIHRSLKPNKLEVYKNDVLIDPPTNKKDYQSFIEKEIIGLDFKTYKMLVFLNLNNQTPILNISKAEKRAFLEQMFDLSLFTNLNQLSNTKISSINNKLKEVNDVIMVNETKISMINRTISVLSQHNFIDIKKKTEELEQQQKELFNSISSKSKTYNEQKNVLQDDVYNNQKINSELIKAESILVSEIKTHQEKIKELKEDEEQSKEKLDKLSMMLDVCIYNEKEHKEKQNILEQLITDIEKLTISISITENDISALNKSLKKIEKLDGVSICPLCDNILNEEHTKKEIERINNEINKLNETLSNDKLLKKDITQNKSNINDEIKELESINKKRELILTKIESIEVKDHTKKINDLENEIILKQEDVKSINVELYKVEDILNKLKEKIKDNDNIYDEILSLNKKTNSLGDEINQYKNISEKEKELNDAKKEIVDIEKENNTNIIKKDKFNDLLQYFKFIKDVCGDEQVKSYAISNMIPFINKKLNEYISISGHPFYIELNDWMEAEIKGIGIHDYDYGNLSSGEAKAVDLSLQFAFLDLAKLQLTNFPDILLLDEILDGSIDSNCLDRITNIIEEHQRKYNNKVYIISHRDNIKNIEAKNVYVVEKKNGFSNIMEDK